MAAALVSSSSSPSPTAVQDAATVPPPSPFLLSFSAIDFGRHLPCSPPLPTVAVLPFLHCHRLRLFLFILRRCRRPPRSSPNAADEAQIFGTDHHRSSLPFLLRPALAPFLIFSVAATRLPETPPPSPVPSSSAPAKQDLYLISDFLLDPAVDLDKERLRLFSPSSPSSLLLP